MPKAKKLPSGSWRVQVYSYTDSDGKKHRESFTAPTKAEAEMKAAEYAADKGRRAKYDLTVGEAIDGYIRAKEGVLSPATIRGYYRMRRNNFGEIEKKRIRTLTSEDVQIFISNLSKIHSSKTVGNVYGLLRPSVALYAPNLDLRVTLPPKAKKRPISPSDNDVRALLEGASPKMKIRVALAILGLRRGEICALKHEDIVGGVAHIHADMVEDKDNNWVYKEVPKTSESDRYIKIPPEILELIGTGEGYIVGCKPPAVTAGFIRLRNKAGVGKRLHDMRHFFASSAAILGIPQVYLADMGGWDRDSSLIRKVYQNNMEDMSAYYSDQMASHMGALVKDSAHESAHGKIKSP